MSSDVHRRADGERDVGHRQRDGAPVGETRGAGDLAGLRLGLAGERVARVQHRPAGDVEADEPPVDVAAVAHAHDRLLAEIAALAVVDGAAEADLHREIVGGDLGAEARLERVDARRLGDRRVELGDRRARASRAARRARRSGRRARIRRRRARARARPTAARPRRAPSGGAAASGPTSTPAAARRAAAAGPSSENSAKPGRRRRGEVVHDRVPGQRLGDGRRLSRVDHDADVVGPHEDPHVAHHLPLGRQQRRAAALPRRLCPPRRR